VTTSSYSARSTIAISGAIRIKKIVTDFGETPADKIKPADIDAWLSRVTKTPATSNRYRALFSLIFREALRNGKIASNTSQRTRAQSRNPSSRCRAIAFCGKYVYDVSCEEVRSYCGGGRLAFVSAMTLTQRKDGEAGASYIKLVELLQSRGANTLADCEQLFRRVLLNIRIHNTDDHLRNHGFFVDKQGIRLSPAYDINPSVDRNELSLAIDETDATCDVAVAMNAYKSYGIPAAQADAALKAVETAVKSWKEEANKFGISRAEQNIMAAAFE
jgi:hypothetical protein